MNRIGVLALIVLSSLTLTARAQSTDSTSDTLHASGSSSTMRARVVRAVTSDPSGSTLLAVHDNVTVTIAGAKHLDLGDHHMSDLHVFLNGVMVHGTTPPSVQWSADADTAVLEFRIIADDSALQAWSTLVEQRAQGELFTSQASVSVGVPKGDPIPTTVRGDRALTIVFFSQVWFTVCLAGFVVLLIIFIWIANKSDILRDSTSQPMPPGKRRPYSLARTQMATWSFVIMGSFLLLWLITGRLDTIHESLVILMGISAGTGIGAIALDGKSGNGTPAPAVYHESFIKDILSDDHGISLHRFQMFAWTAVLVIVFINTVVTKDAMPEFNSTLLVFMGISSGTYLGYKATEK